MGYLANVNPKYFAAINLFAADKDVRFYLCGVRIEPHPVKGALLIATNGSAIAILHDPDGFCREPIIVGEIGKDLQRACKSSKPKLPYTEQRLWIGAQSAVLCEGREEPAHPFDSDVVHASRIKLIDAKYPDWRRILPKDHGDGVMPSVSPYYLARLSAAQDILEPVRIDKDYRRPVRLIGRGANVAVVARFPTMELADRFMAIIMPMTDDHDYRALLPAGLVIPKKRVKYRGAERVAEVVA